MNEYVSIKLILDRLLRHPLLQDLQFDAALDYTVDFMRIVGMPRMFEEKHTEIKIDKYRGILPEDMYRIISVTYNGNKLYYAGDSSLVVENEDSVNTDQPSEPYENNGTESDILPAEAITRGDFVFVQNIQTYVQNKQYKKDCYKIQGNLIYTNIKEGILDVIYSSIPTDDEGFPMILDNSSYLRALELYIKKQWFTILFDMGKIAGPVLQNTQQEYAWAVGDCQSEFNRMTLDQAELFYNSMKNAIRDIDHGKYGFKYLGG